MDKKLALTVQFLALDKLSGSMKKIVGLGKSGTQELARLKREARDLDRQLKDVRAGIMRGDGGQGNALVKRQGELMMAVKAANRELGKQQRFLQIDAQAGKMRAQGERLQSAGQQNMIGGAGMLAPFVYASKQAMDFSSGMVDLQQKAGLTNKELFLMQGNILAVSRATHQMPEDMRAAVDVLAGFGMNAREAVKLARPIGMLGTAFKVDLADGAAAAYANINNLKVAATDTGRAFDIMAAGGNAGAFEIKDMARWFPQLTAQARALGQHGTAAVADLTAALQIARRGAGDSDQAANNIVNLLGKINAPGTIRAFEKNFGVNLPNALKRAYAEGKTPLEAIAEITKKALGGDLTRIGFAFEDRQAQDGLRMLIQDMDDYRSMRAQISKSDGTVSNAFSQREVNDASIAWKSFTSDISTNVLVLGSSFLPVASQFLGIVGGMAGAIGDFAQAHPQATTALLTLVAGMGAARLGLGALQFAFGGILKPAASAWSAYQKFKAAENVASAFPKAARAFGILRTAVMFLAKGVMRAGLMLLANPVVLAITAIVLVVGAAGYLIWKHWDTIKAAFNSGVAMLGQVWGWIKDKIVRFPLLFGPLGLAASFIITHWTQIKAAFAAGAAMLSTAWNAVKQPIADGIIWFATLPLKMFSIGSAIVQGIVRGIMAAPGAVWNALKGVVMGGVANVKALLGIKSPSRVFMGIGGHITDGLAIGVEKGARKPLGALGRLSAGVAGALAVSALPAAPVGVQTASGTARDVAQAVSIGRAPASGQRSGDGGMAGGVTIGNITIHQQPGEDADALVKRVMKELTREIAAAKRREYRDE